jgi:hypothetical protein
MKTKQAESVVFVCLYKRIKRIEKFKSKQKPLLVDRSKLAGELLTRPAINYSSATKQQSD